MLYCVQVCMLSILFKTVAIRVARGTSTLGSKLHCGNLKRRLCERL